ncbi:MAG: geranylgeranyl reductase family protein [Actinomycetota bacterium]|nr:geranylgeranyl reductase family protein [Actinomycetota bacterium]
MATSTAASAAGGVVHADVVVVGAGPGGSTAAAYLADAGHDVVLIDKEAFPRDKPCGDGLTPRAVREIRRLGLVDEAEGRADGWRRNVGLRVHGAGMVLELPWPQLHDWPDWSLTCTRLRFDATLARLAQARGAQMWERTEVTRPLLRPDGRVSGVAWRDADGRDGEVRAPVVIASDGASSRLATALGLRRRDDRPMGVAVRTYYRSPAAESAWLSSYLELEEDGDLLPGYGWVFPLDDGTANVGVGVIGTTPHFQRINYRRLMDRWAAAMPDEWGFGPATREGSVASAALPMGFSRQPHHHRGLLLVGDAGGMVNPTNGEGISYAMESARFAAEVVDVALCERSTAVLDGYAAELKRQWGGYFTLGRWFIRLMGNAEVMRFCTVHGMSNAAVMRFLLRFMAHLTDQRPSDAADVVINTLQKAAPAA